VDLPLFIVFLALVLFGGVLVLFTALTISIRAQDRRMNLTTVPRSSVDGMTRRLLGAHAHPCHDTLTHPHAGRR
jgi:hypothetical protein